MFAVLILEQEFASLRDLPELLPQWLRLVGVVALFFLALTAISQTVQYLMHGKRRILIDGPSGRLATVPDEEAWKVRTYLLCLIGLCASLATAGGLWLVGRMQPVPELRPGVMPSPEQIQVLQVQAKWFGWALRAFTIASVCAILAMSWEMFVDMLSSLVLGLSCGLLFLVLMLYLWMPFWPGLINVTFGLFAVLLVMQLVGWLMRGPLKEPRRIWAIARLSIKEAIHRKALWSFVVLLAVFLFASWFIQAPRPEDQWRTYIGLVFFVMTGLILVTASTLACFSIPGDIKTQTIHTIVTKPVHKFELVLGRIVGFSLLMTMVLVVVAHLSLLYVFRGIAPEFRDEVMRSRVTYTGNLHFESPDDSGRVQFNLKKGNIGREWDYRSYIAGGAAEEAVWVLSNLPPSLQEMERIPVEFNFDIFRTTKGGEDYKEGVSCQFTFINPDKWDPSPESYAAYRQAVEADANVRIGERERAEKYGYYELPSPITIVDYKNFAVTFPGSLLKGTDKLLIRVACRTPNQYMGMAKHDLYLVTGDSNFYLNFLKGTTGIWFAMVVMVTLGVVFSTYLNALVSLLLTWLMLLCGLPRLRDYVETLASLDPDVNPGGGPGEAFIRLAKWGNLTQPLEDTMMKKIFAGSTEGSFSVDTVFRAFFKAFHDILPNLRQYDRMMFVAEGFNIPGSDLAMSVLILIGYLFPFLVAGYYLLNSREVAG